MTKSEIVEYLISNKDEVLEMIKEVESRMIESTSIPPEFLSDMKEQKYQEVKEQIIDELSERNGLTPEEFDDTIETNELTQYLDAIYDIKSTDVTII